MLITICKYIIYFIIYSFIGWCLEVSVKLYHEKRFINRGFLIGPVCPIYGFGVLLIVSLIGKTSDYLSLFLKSILICSILEYYTSYFMEKIFNARWWDYSNKKYNINGRICLETMVPFGLLGSIVTLYIHPFIVSNINLLSDKLIIIVAIILLVILLADLFVSFNVMHKIKNEIKKYKSDSTELIRKKVLNWLSNNSALFVRIKNAFPDIRFRKIRGSKNE